MECYKYYDAVEFKGKILMGAEISGDEIIFRFLDGSEYKMFHNQDCCESVYIYDEKGKISDLFGSEIIESRNHFVRRHFNSFLPI